MREGFDLTGHVLIIAEIGNNHEGDPGLAHELIARAAAAGVDAVKFQTFRTESYVSRADASRFERLKGFELPPDEWKRLAATARENRVLFISTAFDLESVGLLEPLVDAIKVASGDITFEQLLRHAASLTVPIILSTGGASEEEVARAVQIVRESRIDKEPVLLHCVSAYPTPLADANLGAISTLASRFSLPVGFSDHTEGIEAAVTAVALGARVIEKHFTVDKAFSSFRDHAISADPSEMSLLVARVRETEESLGDGLLDPRAVEVPGIAAMRRSVAAARDLRAGQLTSEKDLVCIRPGEGLPPSALDGLVGRVLKRDVAAGEFLRPDDLEEGR